MLFKKKNKCDHKYIDFDWYIESVVDKYYKTSVIEPYVCIFCKHRINRELDSKYAISFAEHKECLESMKETYKEKVKPRAFIEDEINDMILVDKKYIEAYLTLHPEIRSN